MCKNECFEMRIWKYFKNQGENKNCLFTTIIYRTSHSFTMQESVLPHLPKWKLFLNVR
jgi:hypothetical protein